MYDLIGDVHSCYDELLLLLDKLGYEYMAGGYQHPHNRNLIFLGDLIDRGPKPIETLELIMHLQEAGTAMVVRGGHDDDLLKFMRRFPMMSGVDLKAIPRHTKTTVTELQKAEPEWFSRIERFLDRGTEVHVSVPGLLHAVHASYQPWLNPDEFRVAALHGDPSGWGKDPGWKAKYQGTVPIFHGHVNMHEPKIVKTPNSRVISLDTGCCYGGKLTAYRFDPATDNLDKESKFVSVDALTVYYPIPDEKWRD